MCLVICSIQGYLLCSVFLPPPPLFLSSLSVFVGMICLRAAHDDSSGPMPHVEVSLVVSGVGRCMVAYSPSPATQAVYFSLVFHRPSSPSSRSNYLMLLHIATPTAPDLHRRLSSGCLGITSVEGGLFTHLYVTLLHWESAWIGSCCWWTGSIAVQGWWCLYLLKGHTVIYGTYISSCWLSHLLLLMGSLMFRNTFILFSL